MDFHAFLCLMRLSQLIAVGQVRGDEKLREDKEDAVQSN